MKLLLSVVLVPPSVVETDETLVPPPEAVECTPTLVEAHPVMFPGVPEDDPPLTLGPDSVVLELVDVLELVLVPETEEFAVALLSLL